jgi:hypothetical protein
MGAQIFHDRQVGVRTECDQRWSVIQIYPPTYPVKVNVLHVSVYPDTAVRVCQFHVAQAIGRAKFRSKELEDEPQESRSKKSRQKSSTSTSDHIPVSFAIRKKILDEFYRIQRYRGLDRPGESWSEYLGRFETGLTRVGREEAIEEAVPGILDYFQKNWFCERWRRKSSPIHLFSGTRRLIPKTGSVLDVGLPPGQSRDGPWNTNNYIESGFRTLKMVFLESRKNKRFAPTADKASLM